MTRTPITILAFDPAIGATGWAVVSCDTPQSPRRIASGTWRPSQAKSAPDRYDQLRRFVADLIERYAPTLAIVETPSPRFGRRNPRKESDLANYGRAVGVCEAACDAAGVPTNRAEVLKWKGSGRKSQTARVVRYVFGYLAKDDNESDALGLALFATGHLKEMAGA